MLRYLFRARNLHQGYDLVPFIDLGFAYRVRHPKQILAFPLCRAAETAFLLQLLWKNVAPQPPVSISECVQLSKGDDFELLVFSALVNRHVHENALLPCIRLGVFGFVDVEELPAAKEIDTVYTATCGSLDGEVIADINRIRRVVARQYLNVLYHCPKNTKTVDLCILSRTCVLAVQVLSLQSLTSHDAPSAEFLESIGAADPVQTTRNLVNHDWRYIHVTTNPPEKHPIIAASATWNGVDVEKIRLIDATK